MNFTNILYIYKLCRFLLALYFSLILKISISHYYLFHFFYCYVLHTSQGTDDKNYIIAWITIFIVGSASENIQGILLKEIISFVTDFDTDFFCTLYKIELFIFILKIVPLSYIILNWMIILLIIRKITFDYRGGQILRKNFHENS